MAHVGKTTLISALQQLEQSIANPVSSWFQLAYNTISRPSVAIPPPLPTQNNALASSATTTAAPPLSRSAGSSGDMPTDSSTRQRSTSIQSTIGIDTDVDSLILDPV
jgi:GTPase SAR1 family protein